MKPPAETVLFLLSRVLGGKTFTGHLKRVVESMGNIRPHYVYLDEDDYGRYRSKAPVMNRMTGLFIAPSILRWKLRRAPPPPCRAVFVQSFELMPACAELDPAYPVILAHDSTNVLSYRLLRDYRPGAAASLACRIKSALVTPVYRTALKRVRAFMPRSHWCAGSLVEDFGVDPDRIIVAPGGLDTELWKPDWERPPGDPPTLLFVGNDFERKGGEFLLDIFERLRPRARLLLLSNDPALRGRIWPPGVELVSGLSQKDPTALVNVYRSADVFVFPTRKDHMGMALTEAAAVGLPIVATDVGGVGDVVRTGENGALMPYGAGVAEWAGVLAGLLGDAEKRKRFGMRSRAMAESEFSIAALRNRVQAAFSKLD